MLKIPNSKLQAPEKIQIPNIKASPSTNWNLELGASLDVGCWCLELHSSFFLLNRITPTIATSSSTETISNGSVYCVNKSLPSA